jgi:hypothetical protein
MSRNVEVRPGHRRLREFDDRVDIRERCFGTQAHRQG